MKPNSELSADQKLNNITEDDGRFASSPNAAKPLVSRRKLSEQQIKDRVVMYNEAINYFDIYETENESELKQALIVQQQIIKLRDRFMNQHYCG